MAKNAKKGTYTFNELGAIVMKKYPGKFKDLKSASVQVAHVAQRLKIEDINGKRKYKQITASDADRILEDMRESYEKHPRTHSTPLERMAKQDEATEFLKNLVEPQAVTSEQIGLVGLSDPIHDSMALSRKEIEKEENALKAEIAKALEKDPPKIVIPSKVDEFETRRKKFYTDVNYFLKYAQSSNERVAIWGALSKLYGLSSNTPKTYEEPKPSALDAASILDI